MPSSGSGIAGTLPAAPARLAYPTGADVRLLLDAAGVSLTPAQAALLDGYAAAAARTWEDMTNQHPFLAGPEDATRRQNAPVTGDGMLLLDRPLATLTAVAYQPLGGTSTTLVSPDQYLGTPVNAEADEVPYWAICFAAHRWGGPLAYRQRGSLYVTGRWGYTTVLPPNVWEGIRALAAVRVFGAQRFGATGGIQSWKDGNRSIEYGGLAETVGAWEGTWGGIAQTAGAYKNIHL